MLTPGLLQGLVEEICGNLLRTGARRILVVNGHAGSIAPVEAAAHAIRRRHVVRVPALHLSRAAGALRCAGVEFAVPMEVEEVAPGGVACADSRAGSAGHGARLVARLVEAGAAMLARLP